ncbi:TIGR02679 domain-containing protein [Streptomyces physcomitrii]|uniref:TIGR02679 domain-containing protein n=1 Tax=Streptomyces physcomitrii TaxID=2724184 RepID=UPI001FE9F145|nr:TIGR02679 domain-containing protein [Streptomyces physcomitrii]
MSRGVPLGSGAESRRELWDAFDVIVDDLASRVLVLNLPGPRPGAGPVAHRRRPLRHSGSS